MWGDSFRKRNLRTKYLSYFFFEGIIIFFWSEHYSIDFEVQSEHSRLCPDTSSLVAQQGQEKSAEEMLFNSAEKILFNSAENYFQVYGK